MLLGACSDSDALDQGAQDSSDVKGYIAVQIQLPTLSSSLTRAENDNYDDGLAAEYAVNNAALLLFHGTSEANATFYQAIALTLPLEVSDVDNDNLTSSYLAVSEVDETYNTDLWALALVNYTGVFNLGSKTFVGDNGTLGDDFALTEGSTTIADLQSAVFANSFNTSGFFMTNAVLSSASGGSVSSAPAKSNLSILAKLADNCIKDTEKEAKQNPAGTVFVERALAKATLSVTPTTIGTMNITDVEWSLSGTETSSYLVRNMFKDGSTTITDYMGYSSAAFTSTPYYRFAGSVKVGQTAIQPTVDLYRTYWCVDPQYSVDATLNETTNFGSTGVNYPQYCYENTFNVNKQSYDNTTRAVIKVTTDGGDFYTINGADAKSTQAEALAALMAAFMADPVVQNAFQDNYIGSGTYSVSMSSFDLANALTVNSTTGVVTLNASGILMSSSLSDTDFNLADLETDLAAAAAAAAATANAYVDVLKYTDGIMYYEARIQHFAQTAYEKSSGAKTAAAALAAGDLAPWNFWEADGYKPTVGNTSKSYPASASKTPEENYLGRYGMVRNNWYDIEVTAFEHFGSPVEPSFPVNPTPDDNLNSKYIAVKINVLSWAKRTQGWSF